MSAMTKAAPLCYIQYSRAISTGVAHFLHTEGVTGSNPVSPILIKPKYGKGFRFIHGLSPFKII